MLNSSCEPLVGIFWLFKRRLLIDSTPVTSAEPYGDCMTHARGHLRYWTTLQENGVVPADVEYETPPRGRVLFDKRRDRYVLLADRCILNRRDVVSRIMARMRLPPEMIEVDTDSHYRCYKCLQGDRRRPADGHSLASP